MLKDIIREKIEALKKEKNAVILAHTYQKPEIQEIADFVGDSLDLSLKVKNTDAEVVIFCGVFFMAETAKIIAPKKKIILPERSAGCPMADMISAEDVKKIKEADPNCSVVCYINSTASVKALSDICCTSSNALRIIDSIPKDKNIYFIPDMNLGTYVKNKSVRTNLKVWPGYCSIHSSITAQEVLELKEKYPYSIVFVHPECRTEVVKLADKVLSTSQMIKEAETGEEFLVITENGILTPLLKKYPNKTFHCLERAVCPNMKKTSIESVVDALTNLEFEIFLDDITIKQARNAVFKMLEIS